MKIRIEELTCDNKDFIELCKKLDEFQNEVFPERTKLNMSALQGLEKLEKIYVVYDEDRRLLQEE